MPDRTDVRDEPAARAGASADPNPGNPGGPRPPEAGAAVYTHGHHESVLRSHTWRTAANSAGYLLGELRPGMTVLDVGCGPGTITAGLARLVAPGRVTGIDAAPGILGRARSVAAEHGLDTVGFTVADVSELPFPDGSFDVVHAHQVLQHVGDPVGALREMRRVCRPGGVVAARDSDYAAMTWYPGSPALDGWLDLYRRVARGNGGEPDAGRRLLSWARQAGFTDVTASASAWCYVTEEERAWWSGLWADRTVDSAYARLAVDGGHAGEEELRRIAGAWREWGASPDGWFAVLHGEILCRAVN
ncbi:MULTISPECIES: methyltransferase domain-containing protein [Streptomyces]|uniref:Methyltransferase domain-containing protein n=1 Tax=Streptomyces xinghaiensis TaxID=1038928 RepID=A0A3R7IKU8_9ACTN|nr:MULTISPECIES: methyltransferase domain-containing protein [Streptomyces]PQM21102.1 methyltransferase domain-containing protein [Streptomyces xinghaiensis]RKM91077.1 methyltransferase domain-containing protein [Streptomyces xinghaiensis]RNC72543.1 methyltransferase domain-containing protein [Streptomyces xinghaiensis]